MNRDNNLERATNAQDMEEKMSWKRFNRGSGRAFAGLALTALFVLGCEVTNPGPVQDAFLNESDGWTGVVNGAGRSLSDALDWKVYTTAAITREIHPSGSTSNWGITNYQQLGWLKWNDEHINWGDMSEARWTAEDGIRRMLGQPPFDDPPPDATPDPELLAQLYLWAGYANRLLGETQCVAVIDGGPIQPSTVYFDRAVTNFQAVVSTAAAGSDLALAGHAGLASTYANQGNWGQAVTEAALITDDHWDYEMPYYDSYGSNMMNVVGWAMASLPYKAHSMWNTVYGDSALGYAGEVRGSYYMWEPNDPRVPWSRKYVSGTTVVVGDGSLGCCGQVPFWPTTKYGNDSGIDLSSGEEMRLIEAENLLRGGAGSIVAAVTILNDLRTDAGLTSLWDTGVGIDSAWAMLKRDRGIELFVEGRRMFDLRRWAADGTPGALDQLEMIGTGAAPGYEPSHLRQMDLCFPLAESEEQTNPNICADTDGNIIPCPGG